MKPDLDALMGHWHLTSFGSAEDARHAVSMLEQLPPKEYRKALDEMSSKTLGKMLSTMDSDTRASFFAQARQKGAVHEEPGVRMPPREGSPPDKPALLRNDASLRPELREAIHTENKARTADYMQHFDQYVSRYSEAVLAAPTPLALRIIGPPVSEFVLYEPGLIGKDNQTFKTLGQGAAPRARAAKAVNDRISDFAGRPRAGSYSVTASAKASVEFAKTTLEVRHDEKLSDSGARSSSNRAEAMVEVTHGLSKGINDEGKSITEVGSGALKARTEDGKLVRVEGKVGGVGGGLEREDGKLTLSTALKGVPVGSYAAVDAEKGSYGGGLQAGEELEVHGVGKIEVGLKVGFEVQGIAPERLADLASMKDDGIFGPMPELDNGVKWNRIPTERRERLARDGWSVRNWPAR